MNCPYCNKKMVYKNKSKLNQFADLSDPSESWLVEKEVHICKDCRIKNINGDWKIPLRYKRPTKKQKKDSNALSKIFDVDFEPLLARQCKRFINKMIYKIYVSGRGRTDEELNIIGK